MYSLVENETPNNNPKGVPDFFSDEVQRNRIRQQVQQTVKKVEDTDHVLREAVSTMLSLTEMQSEKLSDLSKHNAEMKESMRSQQEELQIMRKRLIGDPEFKIPGIVDTLELLKTEIDGVRKIATSTKIKVYIISSAIGLTASTLTFLIGMWLKLFSKL